MVSRHNARSCVRPVSQLIGILDPPQGAVKTKILCSLQLWPLDTPCKHLVPANTVTVPRGSRSAWTVPQRQPGHLCHLSVSSQPWASRVVARTR